MSDSTSSARTALIVASAIVAVSAVILVGATVMAFSIGIGDTGSGTADQTPFVTDARSVTVNMKDITFSPADLTIDAGTEVTWINEDAAIHDATDREDAWNTEFLSQDESETITFDTPGTFEYYCTVHPWMEGTITVR